MITYKNFINKTDRILKEFKEQPWYKELPDKPKIWDANSPVIRDLIKTLIKGGEYVEELSFGKPGTEILDEGSPEDLIDAIEELSDELDSNLRALRREMRYNKIISEIELEDVNENVNLNKAVDKIKELDKKVQNNLETKEGIKESIKDTKELLKLAKIVVNEIKNYKK